MFATCHYDRIVKEIRRIIISRDIATITLREKIFKKQKIFGECVLDIFTYINNKIFLK